MKHCILLLMLALLLCGCGAEETFETVSDFSAQVEAEPPKSISVDLPGETALPVVESDSARLYLCDDYEIMLQTLEGGDISATMQEMSGFDQEGLTVVQTRQGGFDRYEFVWAAAGETGNLLGRGVILDDGAYHYTMAVLHDPDTKANTQVSWDAVFASFDAV